MQRRRNTEDDGKTPPPVRKENAFAGVLGAGVLLLVALLGAQKAAAQASPEGQSTTKRPPNIVLIMADDLGYNELGSYGQDKIETPYLDRMAANGMRFTQFYSGSPVCAPSRATLLTGQHTGHTYVRDNYGLGGYRDNEEQGQLPLPANTPTMATMLQDAGYATAAIGKWGLGGPGSEGLPSKHGFDYFYGYLDQKQAHNYYPTHLWRITKEAAVRDTLDNEYFNPHVELKDAPDDPTVYDSFKGTDYAPALMHEETLRFIRRHRDEPFFLYRAPVIPHVALQVPDTALAAYGFEEAPYLGQEGYLPHPRPLAAYAAMISWMDRQVGEILALLKKLGLGENTLVIFTSDNGTTYVGGVQANFFDSVKPLRGLKGSVYEGGIRVPMIARWPGRVPEGATNDRPGALWDLLPTFADVAGTDAPDDMDGVSLWPALQGEASGPGSSPEAAFGERPPLYWEYYGLCNGQQAVRMGRWKAVRMNAGTPGRARIELYDLEKDPAESNNVAPERPRVAQTMGEAMKKAHTPSPIERWHIEETGRRPRPAKRTPVHTCLPWTDEN